MSNSDQSEGTWQRLSQVAVPGAEYDSAERLPHPKCLPGTRVKLLEHSHKCLDNTEKSRIVWVHGTAGVGKSAFAFTVAERIKELKTDEEKPNEMRLAGTFFFSRSNAKRSTTAYFFATLAYQLARNFPSVKGTLIEAISNDPALLQPTKSLREQMEALFLSPLRWLQPRLQKLQNCPPLVFVIDALDECTSEHEIRTLIPLLSQALQDSHIPVTHILATSRSEAHVSKAIRDERVYPLVCEIPVKTSANDDTSLISLDGIDVDSDIVLFLKHSFADKQSSHSSFPQPTEHDLRQLAKRAGRRFIIASTMMKFIDESDNCDPHDRLQLMLNLTCDLLPGTEVYELYNQIICSCTDPNRAFLQLSVVVALVDPLSVSQISGLLGFHHGKDTKKLLLQLRSIMDIPANDMLPVKISHSSVRDYVLEPSIRSCFGGQVTSPHSLLASSSLHLMMHNIQKSTDLQDALLNLSKQSGTIRSEPAENLRETLAFMTQRSTAVEVLTALIWLRGDQRPALYFWLDEKDGMAWLDTSEGVVWQKSPDIVGWLLTDQGQKWLDSNWLKFFWEKWLGSHRVQELVQTRSGRRWLWFDAGVEWLQTDTGREWLQADGGQTWLHTDDGRPWLMLNNWQAWLQAGGMREWLKTNSLEMLLQINSGEEWLRTNGGRLWLRTNSGQYWLLTDPGRIWLESDDGQEWIGNTREWLVTNSGRKWLVTNSGEVWLETDSGEEWLETNGGQEWLVTDSGQEWLQTNSGRKWVVTNSGRKWVVTNSRRKWLQTNSGEEWLQTNNGREWLQTNSGRKWLQTNSGRKWLQTNSGQEWLQTNNGREWLQTNNGREWLVTDSGQEWMQTNNVREWLETNNGREWLETNNGREWLETNSGREWLQTNNGRKWLQINGGREWLQTRSGRKWLGTSDKDSWLETNNGQEWLTMWGADWWLPTDDGKQWLQTHSGKMWIKTTQFHKPLWIQIEEFLLVVEAINNFDAAQQFKLSSHTIFQVIQQFKNLPDFLMFPVFLSFTPDRPTSETTPPLPHDSPIEIIRAMSAFVAFTDKAKKRSRLTSGALTYACRNWAIHLSQVSDPWDDTLNHKFNLFWERHILSWLETQWCLSGLESCLTVLSEAQMFVK